MNGGEIAAIVVVASAAIAIVARAPAPTTKLARAMLAGALLLTGSVSAFVVSRAAASKAVVESQASGAPGKGTAFGYVTSSACLGCHPGEHASFRRTFHRTMTQRADATTVKAPIDGRALMLDGRTIRFEKRGATAEVWATLPDPDDVIAGKDDAPDVTRQVLLTTGSHREQAFWVAGRRPGDLRLVPFVWMIRDETFLPRREAFILPPNTRMPPVRWASSCIACHAVAGEPRHDLQADAFDTRVAELGISCEACHGPGLAHVERHRDPVERYKQHGSKTPDPTIVHPARISPERSAAVCGQCHAYAYPKDEAQWWSDGYSRAFRAGDALSGSRTLIEPKAIGDVKAPAIDAPADSIFWPDGAVRVGGREYNGLVESPCYLRGVGEKKMTCLSCHSMHRSDPAGQMKLNDNRMCTGCHEAQASGGHSHHAPGSIGDQCVACHMPKTSYALLESVRSHRIDSPLANSTKPNACNLCHLDRTEAWTARTLRDWYASVDMTTPTTATVSANDVDAFGTRAGLAGDAGTRALIADAFGSPEARAAMKTIPAVLEHMAKEDPYAAVRFIAARSLRRQAGTTTTPIPPERMSALVSARDNRALTIAE